MYIFYIIWITEKIILTKKNLKYSQNFQQQNWGKKTCFLLKKNEFKIIEKQKRMSFLPKHFSLLYIYTYILYIFYIFPCIFSFPLKTNRAHRLLLLPCVWRPPPSGLKMTAKLRLKLAEEQSNLKNRF